MHACTDEKQKERERQRDRGMGEIERQTDGKRCFNETCNCCLMHYNHSFWPESKDDGLEWTQNDRMTEHTHTHTHTCSDYLSLSREKNCATYSWWLWGPYWLWLKGTLPSMQKNVAHSGKKLCALSDWRVSLECYLATGLLQDHKQGYNHIKLERPALNSVHRKANIKFL